MKASVPSFTAERVAFARAAESRRPKITRVCFDPLAEHFVGSRLKLVLNSPFLRMILRWTVARKRLRLFNYVIARTRYMDDYLKTCMDDGIEQLVILGAGYDTRAYRIPDDAHAIRIFEVDHPATQEVKVRKLKRLSPSVTANVTYVATDFEQGSFEQELFKSGYKDTLKTVFVWEGVTYYLTERAVDETLAFVKTSSVPGSSIIFDYIPSEVIQQIGVSKTADTLIDQLEQSGEPLVFGLVPARIEDFLGRRGFRDVHNVSSRYLKNHYFRGLNRTRPVSESFWIVHATVDPAGRDV